MRKKIFIYSMLLSLLAWMFSVTSVSAASLSSMSDTMTRHKISTASNHKIKFKTPNGTAASQTITVTLAAGFTIGTVDFTDIDLSFGATTGEENEQTLAATATTTAWGAAFSGQVLTLTTPSTANNVPAANWVVIEIGTNATTGVAGDAQITNPGTTGSKTISIAGTFPDTGSFAVPINADDRVVVSAAIDPTITFTLSANAADLGTLTTAAVATAAPAITLSAATNAGSGYTIYVQDEGDGTTAGLYKSATPTKLIATAAATLAAGTEGYGLSAQVASGAGTVAAAYNFTNVSNQVGAFSRTATTLASNSAATASDTYTVQTKAAISSTTSAGSYSDTHTYTITATF